MNNVSCQRLRMPGPIGICRFIMFAACGLMLSGCQPLVRPEDQNMTPPQNLGRHASGGRSSAADQDGLLPPKYSEAEIQRCAEEGGTIRERSLVVSEHCHFDTKMSEYQRAVCEMRGGSVWVITIGGIEYCRISPSRAR